MIYKIKMWNECEKMFYHASQVPDLQVLEPHPSNHGVPMIYFSSKRENTLVYLSNAIERYCKQEGYSYNGIWKKWGPYGFTNEGILELSEYYPNALEETYRGVSGYIYHTDTAFEVKERPDIPYVFVSEVPIKVSGAEFISDAYEELLKAEAAGKIVIIRYQDNSDKKLEWIRESIQKEYAQSEDHPEYQFFLRNHFHIEKL